MRKIFILGGSDLQLDLILEAKKMFFYTIVLDMQENCIGSKWCDEFLHVDIANKELILKKAKEYEIDAILTSATEIGNVTACFVGEKLGLNTNSYQTALNTTNKILMKDILFKANIMTSKYAVVTKNTDIAWDLFPCIIKPSDSSAGRGLSYCTHEDEFSKSLTKASKYSLTKEILIENYIDGTQYSCETISSNGHHQLIAIDQEFIHEPPHIMEVSHTIPADINTPIKEKIAQLVPEILDAFNIRYGAAHIELRVTNNQEIYVIEIASRTGGMRSEMINLSNGVSYSQLLLLSSLNNLSDIRYSRCDRVICNFIIDYKAYKKYIEIKNNKDYIVFEPFLIPLIDETFEAEHIGESKGYYFIVENIK